VKWYRRQPTVRISISLSCSQQPRVNVYEMPIDRIVDSKLKFGRRVRQLMWPRGVVDLTHCPVKAEIAGSSPVGVATIEL
jgi:hypothetical protein